MNLPNKLTFIRLVLAVPFIYFLQESNAEGFVYRMIAFALFVVASLTDFFDGYLARKYNLVTDFGKLMDPLADKILVISALVLFVELRYIPAWMSIIVIAREFLISGIRMLAAAKGEVIPAGKLGKYKTTSQMIVILIMIVVGNQWYNFYLMLIPIILTLWSGWEYTSKAKHYFMNSK
ncbi:MULTISPECIES: CDP-diacylglycerol--glycerol-3-phosphate 3-phosphatidyltransferase [Fusobacterium]|jgi:CDP-diacylglycerol--glycerol-3-phosphate 3-phosphatidyltransferase|uniref:CDP-diacylglycerol--glycerol-3-phosphate 3-phosphatidyltransferase n=2 Tax=Fusobacterium ulcerans TaxID=861 RepID=A0AAX1TT28_9FUSO|nr:MULTISPECIES: CDP-diacylglycerol--glycerol-3-phosphate 3-phosphatidyltransferase [Fusobacterium]AVQ26851.1 CDP-diacylglycerol--glycerol-3-phosphate 3-phosphatidyltransferase [Fusobacterium ulcerans]EFS25027.1 CDP-diacylglycerol-glycerol-3-phosphate 3-phosphatidyltransferase [Fusobacterium ulcerans ATCC 49185]EHO83709.1 CDP-diacylglycerol-glycerol-3-phosphate 3-phosphatidyltransferase [Fusobacterium ulcerans 12-1B]MCB8564821.1 CDP-diacylglycerol--glycerol-3-phosphate 3-phosphatidyltransferase